MSRDLSDADLRSWLRDLGFRDVPVDELGEEIAFACLSAAHANGQVNLEAGKRRNGQPRPMMSEENRIAWRTLLLLLNRVPILRLGFDGLPPRDPRGALVAGRLLVHALRAMKKSPVIRKVKHAQNVRANRLSGKESPFSVR